VGTFTLEEAALRILAKSRKPGVPMGKSFAFNASASLMKATVRSDGSVNVEGWISTPHKDLDKDIMEPESFSPALTGYMGRGAPISVEHGIRTLPVGYLHKAVLVRNGNVILDIDNPNHDKTEFRYFNGGTGWYGLGNVYDQKAALGIIKGTVSSFSWIGMPRKWEDQSDGGRRFSEPGAVDPLIEVTVAAYPVNTHAAMRIAKAQGYEPEISLAEIYAEPTFIDTAIDILFPHGLASSLVETVIAEQNSQYRENFPRKKQFFDYFSSYKRSH